MNKPRRKQIAEIVAELETLRQAVEALRDEEQGYFDGMPESIQASDKGTKAEEAAGEIDAAAESLTEAIDALNRAAE